jgi:hypothetical protein
LYKPESVELKPLAFKVPMRRPHVGRVYLGLFDISNKSIETGKKNPPQYAV